MSSVDELIKASREGRVEDVSAILSRNAELLNAQDKVSTFKIILHDRTNLHHLHPAPSLSRAFKSCLKISSFLLSYLILIPPTTTPTPPTSIMLFLFPFSFLFSFISFFILFLFLFFFFFFCFLFLVFSEWRYTDD